MGHGLILETTFLIDLERELERGTSGSAQAFLGRHADDPFLITFTIAGELAARHVAGRTRPMAGLDSAV